MKKILSLMSLVCFFAFVTKAEEPKAAAEKAAKTETVTKASESGAKHSCCSKSASMSACSKKAAASCTPEEKAACDKAKAEKAHSCSDKHTEAAVEKDAPATQPNK